MFGTDGNPTYSICEVLQRMNDTDNADDVRELWRFVCEEKCEYCLFHLHIMQAFYLYRVTTIKHQKL